MMAAKIALVSRSAELSAMGACCSTHRISRYDAIAASPAGTARGHCARRLPGVAPARRCSQVQAAAFAIVSAAP